MHITKSLPAACLPVGRVGRVGRAGRRHQFRHTLKYKIPQSIDLAGFVVKEAALLL
jgi:hypothetical protein